MNDPTRPAAPPRPCPVCGKPSIPTSRPFCSPRCAERDLHRWLSGGYVIPRPLDEDEDPDLLRPTPGKQ